MTQTNIRNGGIALAAFMLLASAAFFTPVAHAADMDLDLGGGWGTTGFTDYASPSYDSGFGGWGTTGYTDYASPSYNDYGGWGTTGYTDYATPAYDYGYSSGGYGGFGGFSMPFMGGGSGGNTQSQSQSQAQSQSSNNTNVNNNVITITQPSPTVVTQVQSVCPIGSYGTYPNCVYPQTQVCPIGSYGTYPNCVYSQPNYDICPNIPGIQSTLPAGYYLQNGTCFQQYAPVPTPYTPYVTLSAVPYTGLELGPIGTFLYWAFLVLWCLAAAYLVVVKKVQNRVVASLNKFLFGSNTHHAKVSHKTLSVAVAAPASLDATDDFIASQINRVR